ncbi:MAG: metallophosphoesterase [Nanobdellota archaeon]
MYSIINAFFVKIKKIRLKKGKKLKIVHLSDLHLGPVLREVFLDRIIKKVNLLKPDIICITGDIVENAHWFKDLKILNNFKAPVYAVLGNHDMHSTINEKLHLLESTKVKVLRNKSEVCCGVNLIGIDELLPFSWKVKKVLNREYDKNKLNILLTHEPLTFRLIKGYPIDLQLAGHTHGGQIFPFSIFVRLFYPVYKGIYKKNGQHIHVSQGTGFWGPPMRLFTQNEITLIKIN